MDGMDILLTVALGMNSSPISVADRLRASPSLAMSAIAVEEEEARRRIG